jgi:hypothetical protein
VAYLSAGHMAGVGGEGGSGAASSIVEFRQDTFFKGRSVTILHTCTLHTQNEGGLDEPFKAGCSKSVVRLNDKFEPQILGRATSLASPILKRAMQVGRWQGTRFNRFLDRPSSLIQSWKDRK